MRPQTIIAVAAIAVALLFSGSALAQKKKAKGVGKGQAAAAKVSARRELMEHLYPIELVRHFASELKLTDDQIEQLRKLVKDVQIEVEDLKWGLSKETNALVDLIASGATKEQVYAQMDKVFKYENKIKKKQMGLMICIRDVLTKKQRAFLDKVKQEHMKKGPPRGPRHGPPGPPPHHGGWGQGGPGGPHPPGQGGPMGPSAPF
jgi:Spy/CpxP family protein refolding chaperone